MIIKKFTGKTEEEAVEAAKKELGDQVVIMNIKPEKQPGVLGMFKKPTYEVTVAKEDGNLERPSYLVSPEPAKKQESIFKTKPAENTMADPASEQALKDAFKEVGDVINAGAMPEAVPQKTYEQTGSVIHSANIKKATYERPKADNIVRMPTEQKPVEERIRESEKKQKEEREENPAPQKKQTNRRIENISFVKKLYEILLANDIDERYINRLIEDMEKVISSGSNIDYMLSNVYQKMVLTMGKPKAISFGEKTPKVVFLIGPTGVGKTTTIAKLAALNMLKNKKTLGFITTDTYRIGATEQLLEYAVALRGAPMEIVYEPEELLPAIAKLKTQDIIFIDTVGFSHKNEEQRNKLAEFLKQCPEDLDTEIYLVLSMTTKYRDLKEIIDSYKEFTDFRLIFTKLDETETHGNILNCKLYAGADLSYVTTGQDVSRDIEVIDTQKMVKEYLGGR